MYTAIFFMIVDVDDDFNMTRTLDTFICLPYSLSEIVALSDMAELNDQDFGKIVDARFPSFKRDAEALHGMTIRKESDSRCKGPYVLLSETTVTRNDLTTILEHKEQDGTLTEFLKEAYDKS